MFLDQPSGEPTREVLELAMDFVRGPIRVALHTAIETGKPAMSKDGVLNIEDFPHRVEVHVMPLEQRSLQGYYLVSFVHFPISQMVVTSDADSPDRDASLHDELRTLRDELQSTIEELQTSNEEMKASHEEVTSVNEELQSTNEELETSKEELQSLNEELTTVNAQLEAKMEELEGISNDLTSLLASSDTAVVFLDRQFRIRRFTPATKPLIDLIPADVGRPLADFARKFNDPNLMDVLRGVLATLVPDQTSVLSDAGRWYVRRVLPYRTADDRIDGVVLNFIDVTDIKRAEESLRLSESRYRTLFESIDEGVCTLEVIFDENEMAVDWVYLDHNPAMRWQTGLTRDVLGKRITELFPAIELYWLEAFGRVVKTGKPERFEYFFSAVQNGWFDVHASRVGGEESRKLVVVYNNITDRKRREERQAYLLKLSDTLRPLADPIAIEVEATRVLGEQLGVGRAFYAEVKPDENHVVIHRDYVADGTPSVTGRMKLVDFGDYWAEGYRTGRTSAADEPAPPAAMAPNATAARACVGVPITKGGRLLGILGVQSTTPREWTALDITLLEETAERTWAAVERARSEAALRAGEARFRAMAEVVPDMLWQADARGTPQWHNQRWTDYTGQTVQQAQEAGWFDRIHPDDRGRARAVFDDGIRTGRPWRHEHRIRRAADGAYRWFLAQGVPQPDENGRTVSWFGSVTDIHSQRSAANELSESVGQLKSVMESARDFAILLMDEHGVITRWNAGATAVFGWTEAEAIGRPATFIFTDEDRATGEPEKEIATALNNGRAPDERWHLRRDGSRFWASGVLSPVRDPDGTPRGFVKILRDTTDRRRAEAERATLLEAEQHARGAAEAANASKDQFLANLGHELRTPLSAMLIWTKVLQDQPNPAILAEGLAALEQSAKVQQKLINDLLDSARIASGKMTLELKPVHLGQVIRDAAGALRPTLDAKGVELQMDVSKAVGVVMADAERLQQVVWNLINNAVKFTPAGGRIDVGVRRRDGKIEVRVADTGQGIDADLLPLIFGRFQQGDASRTRRHSGLGLGLSISRQIVELHGGTIEAASDGPNRGSVFTVRLPLPRSKATDRPPTDADELGGVRVVLVEDDVQLRDVVRMLLQRAGATVTSFDMADPALASLLADPPDVLLCDIGLPDKDGYALIREVREQEPADARLPAIAFTAFDRPQDRMHALECGFDEHLAKPVEPTRLVQTIRAIIQAAR